MYDYPTLDYIRMEITVLYLKFQIQYSYLLIRYAHNQKIRKPNSLKVF